MSFIEFLYALKHELLANEVLNHTVDESISEVLHEKLLGLLGEYMAVGGMPKVLSEWVMSKDVKKTRKLQDEIIDAYQMDFSKYAKKHEIKYVDMMFRKVPAYLCKRFKYSQISEEYRKRELGPALFLLEKAGVVNIVYHTHGNGRPLGAEVDFSKYKVIMNDIALTQAMLDSSIKNWILDAPDTLVNKGEIAEAF